MSKFGTNTKKYAEAMQWRDWETCNLICEEHEILLQQIQHTESENKKLREELAIAEGEWKAYFKANESLSKKMDEAIKCIEYYANFRNYSHYMDSEMPVYRAILFSDTEEINDMTKYAGKLARTTLKAIKGEK